MYLLKFDICKFSFYLNDQLWLVLVGFHVLRDIIKEFTPAYSEQTNIVHDMGIFSDLWSHVITLLEPFLIKLTCPLMLLLSPSWYIPRIHDDVIKWKHFPRNWPFVREIHRSPVNFPHKGQWRGALMFSLNYAWINDWVNNREAGDLRRQHGHYDVIVMSSEVQLLSMA